MPSVFIAHSSRNKRFVRRLAEELKKHGVKPWVDEAEIRVGESFIKRIGKAIHETDFVVVVLSRSSIDSKWVQEELEMAMQRQLKEKKVVVLPILRDRLKHKEIPPFLRTKHYADFTKPSKFDAAFAKLLVALGASARLPEKLVNSIGMEFVLIPAGTFLMGSPEGEGEDDEHPQHKVNITRPFYMGVTPVTQAQWKAVMPDNPSHYEGDDHPIESVSWNDAQGYIADLSRKERIFHRLPTEAEWEYACRAGSKTTYYFGDDPSRLGEYAWYEENSNYRTHPVGKKKPNAWGLYDMLGNVWEFCADWYDEYYYRISPNNDPKGLSGGDCRVLRGCSWTFNHESARCAKRFFIKPSYRSGGVGFRCAR